MKNSNDRLKQTRNIISEIEKVRQRKRFKTAINELPSRLKSLEHAYKNFDNSQRELIRYFPVALIACMEGYFRSAIKDLIDIGDPYLENSENIASSIKLDFTLLRAVHGKSITVGELVSHGVPLSRLDHVMAALTAVIGKDFKNELRQVKNRMEEEEDKLAPCMLQDTEKVLADVTRTYELRHIICHEIASGYTINPEEIKQCFESCVSFLKAADEIIFQIIDPEIPATFGENLDRGVKELREEEAKLSSVADEVRDLLKSSPNSELLSVFEKSQDSWINYRNSWIEFIRGDRIYGGSSWTASHAPVIKDVVTHRKREILRWLEDDKSTIYYMKDLVGKKDLPSSE